MAEEITVPDRMYDPETVEAISRLRHERWHILGMLSNNADGKLPIPPHKVDTYRMRLERVNKELFALTNNPIYHV